VNQSEGLGRVMHAMPDRRHFLKTLAGGAVGLAVPPIFARTILAQAAGSTLPSALAPAGSAPAPLSVSALDNQLAVISGAGGNVVALSGAEGLLLVDSGSPEHSHDLLRTLADLPGGKHIDTVFNTHWHWDHTGGNELLRERGARIIAHENTRLWLGAQIWEEWQNRTYEPRPAQAWPTETFYTDGKLTFAGEPIEYGYLSQAHTDGDIYVYFRGRNVLVTGCVLSVGRYPILDYCTGGWIGGMADATEKLLAITDDKTRIVPGVGPLATRADLAAEHEMLATLKEDLWQLMRKGLGAEDMLATHATSQFDPRWGSPDLFIPNAYRGLYDHVRELRGVV
jgi:glyoxylase-like metal-dependent hydrolase (beta-lactamase superfamily II)